jgi:hypothetical protein
MTMIKTTSLKSYAYLARVKAAVLAAVRKSHAQACPVAIVHVLNRKGENSLAVVARRRVDAHGLPALEFFDTADNDVTEIVLTALQAWHAVKRVAADPLPLITVEYDSGPLEGLPLHIRPALVLTHGSKAA